ncbi:MAG: hypothetical protein LBL44_04680 [Treponema sp.]|jgi:hypothetical protein|nr:hypothetical protein [Treponema sp.]
MPFLSALVTKLKTLPRAAADFFGKKRIVLAVCLAAALILLILGLVMLTVMNNNAGEGDIPQAGRPVIPPEELFLPEEPGFVPPVLLEREPRESWSAEDAAPFWHDPLERGEEPWRERIEAVIDDLLKEVP